MATATKNSAHKEICTMCSPKQVIAVTSCKGCLKDLCRKHFNEHRDILSEDLHNVVDRHDNLLQELQDKTKHAPKLSANPNARVLLTQIDEWEMTTIMHVSKVANRVRDDIQYLFDRTKEYDHLKNKLEKITEELKEQQESESFVEPHLNDWLKRLDGIKADLNRPSGAATNPPHLQIRPIDWDNLIALSPNEKIGMFNCRYLIRYPILHSLRLTRF